MAEVKPVWLKNLWFCAAKTVFAVIPTTDSSLTGNPLLVYIVGEEGGYHGST